MFTSFLAFLEATQLWKRSNSYNKAQLILIIFMSPSRISFASLLAVFIIFTQHFSSRPTVFLRAAPFPRRWLFFRANKSPAEKWKSLGAPYRGFLVLAVAAASSIWGMKRQEFSRTFLSRKPLKGNFLLRHSCTRIASSPEQWSFNHDDGGSQVFQFSSFKINCLGFSRWTQFTHHRCIMKRHQQWLQCGCRDLGK